MIEPYHLIQSEKERNLLRKLNELSNFHNEHCENYSNMMYKSNQQLQASKIEEVPYLPVQLFKLLDLKSISDEEIVKVLTSSGTTGQQVSKIYLDKKTATEQTRALIKIMKPILGDKRLPMVILDTKSVLKNRKSFSARGAGILGFANFGYKPFYALNDDMSIDIKGLQNYLEKYKGQRILLFGFTFMIWQYIFKESLEKNIFLDFSNGVLIHGGGWKKLKDEAVSSKEFNRSLYHQFGIKEVHNYYGMVEQVGSIFLECSEGYLHAPSYADIIIRNPITFETVPFNKQGLIQVVSELPNSYPGHSILTEDLGTIRGLDDCNCGWKGKYFTVEGRIPKAEVRGCSDTFQGGDKA